MERIKKLLEDTNDRLYEITTLRSRLNHAESWAAEHKKRIIGDFVGNAILTGVIATIPCILMPWLIVPAVIFAAAMGYSMAKDIDIPMYKHYKKDANELREELGRITKTRKSGGEKIGESDKHERENKGITWLRGNSPQRSVEKYEDKHAITSKIMGKGTQRNVDSRTF